MTVGTGRLASVKQDWVPMRDNVRLAADIYRPPRGRVPALLLRTPYDRKWLEDRTKEVDPMQAVDEGFAVVIQDVRGRFGSNGEFEALVPDVEDAADTVAWIRRQSWSDGRVMMVGRSYDGGLQFQAARARPEGLVAIAPTMSGAARTFLYPGGALRLVIGDWMGTLLADALNDELDAGVRDQLEELFLHATPLERFHAFIEPDTVAWQIVASLRRWVSAPSDGFWAETTAVPRTPLPAVHTTGFYDLCLAATVEAYSAWNAIGDPAAPQLLTLGPWNHNFDAYYPSIGLDWLHAPSGIVALKRQMAFFDAMLGRTPLEDLAPVMSFVLGRNRWHEDTQWPPANVRPLELRLLAGADDDRRLAVDRSSELRAVSYRYDPRDPVPTIGGAHTIYGLDGPIEQAAIESRRDVLVFTSSPFEAELEIAGAPTAHLLVASSAPATDFIARLTLVEPDGRSLPLVRGIWSGRLADLPIATAGHRGCDIELEPIHVALAPGTRLRLQITSSCYPEIYPNPNTGHDLTLGPPPRVQIAEQSLLVGGAEGSAVSLPIRGAMPREIAP
jgi:putative CocE/NonD family hydrolase